jgi:hypothetical protein
VNSASCASAQGPPSANIAPIATALNVVLMIASSLAEHHAHTFVSANWRAGSHTRIAQHRVGPDAGRRFEASSCPSTQADASRLFQRATRLNTDPRRERP